MQTAAAPATPWTSVSGRLSRSQTGRRGHRPGMTSPEQRQDIPETPEEDPLGERTLRADPGEMDPPAEENDAAPAQNL